MTFPNLLRAAAPASWWSGFQSWLIAAYATIAAGVRTSTSSNRSPTSASAIIIAVPASVCQAGPVAQRHVGCSHEQDELLAAAFQREHLGHADGECPPGLHDARSRDDGLAAAGREQVHLELRREYCLARRHEGEGGVAARAVGHRRHDARVEEPVLLHEVLTEGEADVHLARRDPLDGGSEEP